MQKIKHLRSFIQIPLLIIIILLISIVAGIGYKVFKNYNTSDTEISKEISECDKIQDQTEKDFCYRILGSIKQDLSICDKIQNQDYKDGCYSRVAEAKQDLSICNEIQDQYYKDICYSRIAIVSKIHLFVMKFKINIIKMVVIVW